MKGAVALGEKADEIREKIYRWSYSILLEGLEMLVKEVL